MKLISKPGCFQAIGLPSPGLQGLVLAPAHSELIYKLVIVFNSGLNGAGLGRPNGMDLAIGSFTTRLGNVMCQSWHEGWNSAWLVDKIYGLSALCVSNGSGIRVC